MVKIDISVETIDPHQAKEILAQAGPNFRTVNHTHVRFLADQMIKGKWQVNGEAIKFDQEGKLIDGQHRLHALLLIKKPLTTLVVRGLGKLTTMDEGRSRSAADKLANRGFKNAKAVAAMARMVFIVQTGQGSWSTRGAHQMYLDVVAAHPRLTDYVDINFMPGARLLGRPAAMAAMAYCLSCADMVEGPAFIRRLAEGADLVANSAVHRLRERMVDVRRTKSRMHDDYALALMIKAWNHTRAHGNARWVARYVPGADGGESFPRIVGARGLYADQP
jgi:hypothetical protein